MILEAGQFGILGMCNTNTKTVREMMMVYKGMNLTGMPTMKPLNKFSKEYWEYGPVSRTEIDLEKNYVVELGYNEMIYVKDRAAAVTLLTIINGIFVSGEEAETAIDNMLSAMENIFFQTVK
jgi:bacterioferritin (cytochrome b1)